MPRLPSEFCPVITEMYPDIFFHDFERTEHSDSLHAILGRALIVATRFDAMCVAASRHKEFNELSIDANSNEDISKLLNKIANKNQTLHASIKRLNLQEPLSEVLAAARRARNSVAHDLAKGMTGCLDSKINEEYFVQHVSELVEKIAYGDLAISHTISGLNKEPSLTVNSLRSYVDRIIKWVVEK